MNSQPFDHWLVPVRGLTCAGCVRKLEKGLKAHAEVHHASVNLALETLDITLSPGTSAALLKDWVSAVGFDIPATRSHFRLANVSCASCVNTIEKTLQATPGVVSAQVNLALGEVDVERLDGVISEAALKQRLLAINYPVINEDSSATAKTPLPTSASWWPPFIGLGLSAPMLVTMAASLAGLAWMLPAWLQFALTTPVLFILGARFFKGAYSSLKQGAANMDVLVVLGTSTAYLYSLYLWFATGTNHLYFEAAAVIISLVLLGKTLEGRAKRKTSAAIRQLMNLQPKRVDVRRDGDWASVEVTTLAMGDEVRIKPGSTIGVDGLVVSGESDVNEALVTGESRPISKTAGDTVLAGAHNHDGQLMVKVTSNPSEFRVQQIAKLVEQAQMNKPKVQQLVDRIAAVFVPAVLGIAALTLGVQWSLAGLETALVAAVSVLVIACPCALGLATPTAIIAASGVGARLGVLIRDMDELHQMNRAHQLVFDKTGTLSQGTPALTEQTVSDTAPSRWREAVVAIQARSQHPLAQAMVTAFKTAVQENGQVNQFINVSGKGVHAQVENTHYWLGTHTWLQSLDATDADFPNVKDAGTEVWAAKQSPQDATPVVFARFVFNDPLREESFALIKTLKQRGYTPWILSGDNANAVTSAAEQLGITQIMSGLLPEHKQLAVQQIQNKHGPVIMVGDGINDAPALSAADAAIAMGDGTDIAVESAGITLMRPDIRLIDVALQLARKTEWKIKQNLFWAFIYNLVGIPLAAFGLLTPVIAGLAMAFSSVSVVTSSLLLQRWQPKEVERRKLGMPPKPAN